MLADCLELLREVSHGRTIAAIGAGVPELVSLEGKIQSAENWDWRDDSFRPALAGIAPLHIESDVRAAALAEARFGAKPRAVVVSLPDHRNRDQPHLRRGRAALAWCSRKCHRDWRTAR